MVMRFYRGSYDPLPEGTILTVNSGQGCGDLDTETLMERLRPEGCIPRLEAIYGCLNPDDIDNAGGPIDVIHVVEAGGIAEVSDLSWVTQAQVHLENGEIKEAAQCARAYWEGAPWPDPEGSCPEVRMSSARVVRKLHHSEDSIDLRSAALSDATNEELQDFTCGECHVLAIAMHRQFGWTFEVYFDENEPFQLSDDDDDTMDSIAHVFAEDPEGRLWDVTGWRGGSPAEVLRREDLTSSNFATEAEFMETCVSSPRGVRPLTEVTETMIAAATKIAHRVVSGTSLEFPKLEAEASSVQPALRL